MFDIGAAELLVIVVVAVLVIGPKDMPKALKTAGSWIGKVRRVSAHFRSGLDAMVREAELEEMEQKWKARNEEIMARTGKVEDHSADTDEMTGPPPVAKAISANAEPIVDPAPSSVPVDESSPSKASETGSDMNHHDATEPSLPLEPPADDGEERGNG